MGEHEDLDKRMSVHEAICAERYMALITRMGRIEKIIVSVGGAMLAALLTIIVKRIGL